MITEGWADHLAGPFGIAFAFAAGVISFLSPCVLPLVPAYIAHLTGVASTPEATPSRRETLSHAFAFVLGFGVVFTVIGASVGLVGGLVRDELPTLEKVAGVFLIVLGLNLMGVIKVPWLYRTYQLSLGGAQPALAYAGAGSARGELVEPRGPSSFPSAGSGQARLTSNGQGALLVQSTALSYARSLGFGSAFAVAWTPCIGPVLGAILTLAAASSTVHQGAYLLLAYSAGLALPFLAAGYALGSVTAGLRRFGRFLPALELATGAVVLLVGVLVFLNEFTSLNQYFDFIPQLWGV
ncbi:MAG TPA: cytochrome c biogenesis CcdA family protein [Dehalococcoidia bacterium]